MFKFDKHIKEVLRGTGTAFVLRGFGSALAFLLNVVIGRLLGVEGAGLYFIALSIVSIGAIIAKLGLDAALVRFIAVGASSENWNSVVGVFNLGTKLASGASLAGSVLLIAVAPNVALNLFGKPELTNILYAISFGIFTFSMMMLMAESLKGLKLIGNAMLVSGLLYPLIAIAFIWPLVSVFGVAGAALAFVLGTGSAAAIGRWMWAIRLRNHPTNRPRFDISILIQQSSNLWLSNVITGAILPWLPLFLLGVWGTATEVGLFGAASRVSMVVTFFLVAVNTAIAPKFAELYAKGDVDRIRHIALLFSIMITTATSPLFVILIFKSSFVMELFGQDFVEGGQALAIIAIGQSVVCMTGVGGQVLMMAGHVRHMRIGSIFALIVTLLGAVLLIPEFGITGAAITIALSVSTINVYLFSVSLWLFHQKTL